MDSGDLGLSPVQTWGREDPDSDAFCILYSHILFVLDSYLWAPIFKALVAWDMVKQQKNFKFGAILHADIV